MTAPSVLGYNFRAMTTAELAAYIGAAAWVPHILTWLYRRFATPLITLVPDKYAEIGFTGLGPIFNVRMALISDRKDAVIDGFQVIVTHKDGDSRTFRWSNLSEHFSEVRDNTGYKQTISREQKAIALLIGTQSLIEKFVMFQEPRYYESTDPPLQILLEEQNFLRRSNDPDIITKLLSSKALFALIDARQKGFWWKPGQYEVEFRLSSPRRLDQRRSRFNFHLRSVEVDRLKQNIDAIKLDLEHAIKSNMFEQQPPLRWNWATVNLDKR